MSRSVIDRLSDIIHSAELAARHAGGRTAESLAVVADARDATLFRIAVIGEVVSHLPTEVQALAPEIPWNDIKSMRNHVIHGYWQVDFRIVVETIAVDLDPLKAAAGRLVSFIESDKA
jgi:uncharacterized protein with HEPN domain